MAPRGCFAGLTTLDLVHRVAAPVEVNEKVTVLRQDLAAGGPAANAAATFAALGGSAVLLTALGAHPLAIAARADLAERGVEVLDVSPDKAEPPPVSAVRVLDPTGERSVTSINDRGEDAPAPADVDLGGFDVLVVDGWHPNIALAATVAARAAEIPVVLGAGTWRPLVAELLPHVDYAIVSAGFPVERLGGVARWACTDGAEPVRWHEGAASGSIDVPHVGVRDTLGAGDTFLGAAAFALVSAAWPDALRLAVGVASRRVQHVGMRDGLRAAASTEMPGPAR